jgi:hypothetical protein
MTETKRYRPSRSAGESIRMMDDPDNWPQWPLLPLKRYAVGSNDMETGYMIHVSGEDRTTVFQGNIFMAQPDTDPAIKYDGFQEIVNDGWEVD